MTDAERTDLTSLAESFARALSGALDRALVPHDSVRFELRDSPEHGSSSRHYATVGWGKPWAFSANLTHECLRRASLGNYLWDGARLDLGGLAARLVDRAIGAGHLKRAIS